jgi:spore germination protein KB
MNVEKGKICSMQLFFLFAGFVQGSVLLVDFAIGISESQTWMVILIGLGLAIPFVLSYVALAKRFPGMNVVQINDAVYGRFLGKTLSLYYIFFFLMTLSFNIRDVGELYITFLMQDTSFIFLLVAFSATCAYAVSKGLEVLARISHLIALIGIFVPICTTILLIDQMDFSNFLPLFELPFARMLHGIHIMMAIPFCETLVFLMIMASLDKAEKAKKSILSGLLVGTVSLFIVAVRNTAVLGNTQTIWTSPSFQSTRLIDIGTVLTRMDFLIGIAQTFLIFFKCCLFLYASVTAIAQIFNLKTYIPLVLPVAGIEVILAATVFQSKVDHAEISQNAGIIYSAPLMFLIPPLTPLIAKLRNLPNKGGKNDS